VVASQGKYSLISQVADGLVIDLNRPEESLVKIERLAAEAPFAAILGSDDGTVELAGRASERLGLPHNSAAAMRLTRRKDLARACLRAAAVPVPDHWLLDLDLPLAVQAESIHFPCVIKPVAMSGSRGVIRVNDVTELLVACERIRPIVGEAFDPWEQQHILVEAYLEGQEVALEGFLTQGQLETLAIFDKPEPLTGPYFEESYYVTPSRHSAEDQAHLASVVQAACQAYGLSQGAIHAELRLHRGQAWIIEVAARTIGGQCARLFRLGAGVGLEELVLARSMGQPLALSPREGGGGVLMISTPAAGVLRRVEGVLAAQKVPYIDEIEISLREGYELVPLPEGDRYLGFIFAHAPDASAAEQALRSAYAHLNVVVAPLLRLESG